MTLNDEKNRRKHTNIRLPGWLKEWLKQKSKKTGKSQGRIIEEALVYHFEMTIPEGENFIDENQLKLFVDKNK